MTSSIDTEQIARTIGAGPKQQRRRWLRYAAWLLAALVVAAVGVGVFLGARRARAVAAQRYVTAEVTRGDLRIAVTATGTLSARGAVEVGSEVSGRVQNVYVDFNDRVTKGQVLAELDPVELKAVEAQATAQLAASRAAIETAAATLVETTQTLARVEAQVQQGLVPTRELESAKAAHARAQAAVASANANASLARANLSSAAWKVKKTKILSPIDGVVLSRSIAPGQTVAAAFQTPVLFKLATDLTQLELNVQVDESDVGRVQRGMSAEFRVDAHPDRSFASRVLMVRNEAKTSSNVVYYEAILSVDNSAELLRPGMTATATITSELHQDVLRVSNAALRFEPPAQSGGPGAGPPGVGGPPRAPNVPVPKNKKRLYALGGDGKTLVTFDVTPGPTDGVNTEVQDTNLSPGTAIVIDVEDGAP